MTLIAVLLAMCIPQAWAERWVSKCNIKYYTHNGITQTHDGWYNNDGFDIATANVTYNFGTLTQFYFKESWAQGSFDNNWGTAGCKMVYGFSADNQTDYKRDWGDQTGDNPKHYDFPIDQYDVIDHAPNKPGENTLFIYYHLNYNRGDGGDRKSKTLYINFTIPGFTGAPSSKDFGSKNVINKDNETTISFTHYGTALTSSCTTSITGTNASEFYVRKIENGSVIVVFKPTSTGSKSATLTLTDAHGKTCSITLSGSGVALGTTTRLYFNDYTNHGDWSADGAKYRVTCQYTSGVYTNYPLTLCDNSTYTYYADVELKDGTISKTIDRYNPSSPYVTWNSSNSLSLSSSNPYAISNGKYTAYVANHPFNNASNSVSCFYYDNSDSEFSNNKYLVIGRDYRMSDGASDTYSAAYSLSAISNTNLFYKSSSFSAWPDATYYAVIGASSVSGTSWGSSSLSTKGTGGYTKAYKDVYDLESSSYYLASAPSSNSDMTISKISGYAALNCSITIAAKVKPVGGAYTAGASKGALSGSAMKFSSATSCGSSSSASVSVGSTSSVLVAGYTCTKCTLSVSSVADGYTFRGWYNASGTKLSESTSYTGYLPKGDATVYAYFEEDTYTITYNNMEGATNPGSNPSSYTINSPTINLERPSKSGYGFGGWYSDEDCTTRVYSIANGSHGNKVFYAKWLTPHEPGYYVSNSPGYNVELTTYSSLKYELYRYTLSSSTAYLNAGETPTSSSASYNFFNFVKGNENKTYTWTTWLGHTPIYNTSDYSSAKEEFPAKSIKIVNCRDKQGVVLCIKGYKQFSYWGQDNNSSKDNNKQFFVYINGKDSTKERSSTSGGTIRRYTLDSTQIYVIEILGNTPNSNGLYGFSMRPGRPKITSSSLSGAEYAQGASATPLSVTATKLVSSGTSLSYQWYSNTTASNTGGTIIDGATSASYTPPTTSAGTTYYYCVVSETGCNSTTSSVSGAIVVTASCTTPTASWATAPANGNVGGNMNATLTTNYATGVVYTSSNTDVATVSGDGTTTCTINYVAAGTARITATVTGDGATICTGPATCYTDITVSRNTPTAYAVTGTAAICSGGNTNITLANSQTGASYQLKKGGVAEGDAKAGTGEALTWSVSAAGTYTVSAVQTTKYSALDMTGSAVITFKTNTAIETQPTSIAKANVGAEQTLSVVATGSNLEYQWYSCSDAEKTGATELTDETGDELSVTPAAVGVIYYYCVVSGDCGDDVTSNVVSITAKNAISPTLTYASTSIAVGAVTAAPTVGGNTGSGTVTYTSSNTDVATVDSDGKVTAKAVGSATITATIAETTNYWGNTATASFTVGKGTITPSLSYSSTTLYVDDTSSSPTVSGNTGSGTVSYAVTSSSPSGCITVDSGTGVVTAVAAGTGTVTATVAATTNYNSATCTADFTVNSPCFYADDLKKKSKGSDIANNAYITASLLASGTITGGTLQNTTGGTLGHSEAEGIVYNSNDAEVTLVLTGSNQLAAGSVITLKGISNSSTNAVGFTVGGQAMSEGNFTPGSASKTAFTRTYTVAAESALDGVTSFKIKRSTSEKVYLNSIKITGCGEATMYDVTVAYNGSGSYGTASAADDELVEGGTTVVTATPATGYQITAWEVDDDDNGASIDDDGSTHSNTTTLTMGSADATVTATFSAKTYLLTLDKNGGSADGEATATYNSHSLSDYSAATNSNPRYSLAGYYTAADGGLEIVTLLGGLTAADDTHDDELEDWVSAFPSRYWIHDNAETLYAHWWRSVNLDANKDHHGKTNGYAKAYLNGSAFEITDAVAGQTGYTLQGFYTAAVGGSKVLNPDGTVVSGNVTDYVTGGKWTNTSEATSLTLYARWAKEFTVTYDDNDATSGTAPAAQEDQPYGTTITVASNSGSLVKTGYTFVGWNTEDDGTGTYYAVGSEFTLTEDITLYAQWEDCGGGGTTIISISPSISSEEGSATASGSIGGTAYWDEMGTSSPYKLNNDGAYFALKLTSSNYYADDDVLVIEGADKAHLVYTGVHGSGSQLGITGDPTDGVIRYTLSDLPDNTDEIYVYRIKVGGTTYNGKLTSMSVVRGGSGGGCTTYTVSFADMTGFVGSSTLPDDISDVYDGATIAEPVQPTATGYAFAGWYKEGACSNKWDFSTDVVDDDITLYAKWIDVSGKYTFHYGDGQPTDNTWVIKTFTEAGSGYHKIEDFEIPDADKYPSFFVGYEGAYDTETAHSQIYTWDAATGLGNGHMPIRHWGTRYGSQSELPIAGNGNTAEGAKGTLRISTTGSTNCYVGFYPNGFGLIWNRETTALHATPSPEVFETDVVTLTADEAAGNFEVKLATEDSYVAYSRTATETAEGQLNDRKVAGETYDIAAGTVGRFQINLSKKDNNYGLRFVPLVNRTTTSGNWETDNNWTLWRRPNIEETAYVAHFTTIKTPTAQAKKVIVDKTSGVGYPKVSIASGYDGVGGLLVEDHIQVLKMVDDEPTISEETTYSELEINSSAYGSAALIMGDASTTTAAYTTLYTKAMYDVGYGWVNQYIGTPSANGSIYDFYGSYLYVYSPVNSNWVQANRQPSYAMPTFKAYNLMREESAPGSYSFYDPLVFPGITDGKLKELICDDENDETDPEDNRKGAYMFANSWTAPIDVKAMEESDFDGSEATIYIFNAGSPAQAASAGDPSQTAEDPGQWVSIPVNAAPYLPENLTVIPSMQAFRIVTTEATASLTLDYKKHVYDPAKNRAAGIEIKPLRAPKHNDAKPNILKLFVEAASGYRDNLYLFERQDFSETFDNGWDGSKMFGISNAPQIYGVNGELKTSINAIPDLEGQQVGFMTGKADSEYTITFNYEGDDTWYLNDTKEHESTLISNDAEYTFTTEPSEDSNRFYISATPIMKVTTGVENVQSDDVQSTNVHKVLINDHIYIIRGGRMYDATGKMLK